MNTQVPAETPSLTGCWRMDEASLSRTYDAVNKHEGIMNGNVTWSNPSSPLTYTWSPATGLSNPNVMNTQVITPVTSSVTYILTGVDGNGCTSAASATLTPSQMLAPRLTVEKTEIALCSDSALLNVGKGIHFNGSSNINIPGYSWPTGGGAITIEFWTKVNRADNPRGSAFHLGLQDQNNRVQASVPWDDKKLHWDYGNATGTGRISADYTKHLDKWTHVALVSAGNGGNFKAIYLDGILSASGNVSDGPDVALNGLLIGSFLHNYHKGIIDEFRIWNKVLSPAEINTAMNTQIPAGTPNLTGCWRMDEASGNAIYDIVNGKNGTFASGIPSRVYPVDLTYQWTPTTNLNKTTGPSVKAAAPSSGSSIMYTVIGTGSQGCSNNKTITVTHNPCREAAVVTEDLENSEKEFSVNLYPNPSPGEVTLEIHNGLTDKVKVSITTLEGIAVYEKENISAVEVLKLDYRLPSGMYVVKVIDGNQVRVLKFIRTE